MPLVQVKTTDQAAGTDLMAGSIHRSADRTRRIYGVGLAAASTNEGQVELYIGDRQIATIFPVIEATTGVPAADHIYPLNDTVPTGTEIRARVEARVGGAGEAGAFVLEIDDAMTGSAAPLTL